MKHKLLILSFTLISTILCSQSQPMAFEDWKTTAGTQNFFYKNVTKTDKFGNIYVAGATLNALGNTDILLAKYNPSGVQLWIQQYAGAGNGVDFAAGLAVTDSYAYLTGAVTNNTATPETDVITMKYSATGVLQWASTYNGSGSSLDVGKHIVVDASGNVFITGASYNASLNTDFVSIRYDASGTQQWASTFDYLGADDAAIKIAIAGSNLTVTGAVTSAPSNYKFATLTLAQSTGSITATNISSAVTTASVDVVTDFTNDGSGNIIIVGSTYVAGQGENYYVQKLNSALATVWTYTFNGASSLDDVIRGVQADASGNIYITGYSTSSTQGRNITTIKLNSSGVSQWTQIINGAGNGDDEGADMIMDVAGNLYLTGYQTVSVNDADYYTIKYNTTTGAKIWDVFTDGMSLNDKATNMALDSLNNIIVTGQSSTTPSTYNFMTTKYVQLDVTNPVDLYSQATNKNIGFHANKGQLLNILGDTIPSVFYYTHHQNPEIYLEKSSYNYMFTSMDTISTTLDTLEKIHVSFTGANSNIKPYGYNPKTYPLNYFLGHQSQPITNIIGMDRVITQNIYPNIDLHYFSNSKGFKYYFVVNEGANPKNISLAINGASTTSIVSSNLFIDGILGNITLKQPYAYMVNSSGVTTTLTGTSSWSSLGSNNYAISVPTYTTSQKLIIVIETVPVYSTSSIAANLDYSTYFGGNTTDQLLDIKVATNGDRVISGLSAGGTFPNVNGLGTSFLAGNIYDAVIIKYLANDSLKFATFYGGNGAEFGNSIALNSLGEIFVGGETQSTNLLTTLNAGQTNQPSNGYYTNTSFGLKSDGLLLKLSKNGNVMQYARYVGGSKSERINSIYIDTNDNLYIAGYSSSTNFPVVAPSKGSLGASSNPDNFDCIVGKFNSSQLATWITYYGGNNNGVTGTNTQDDARDIVVDNSGNVFICGTTDAYDFPTQNPSSGNPNVLYNATINGSTYDGFIARFTSGGVPNYATYVGGNGSDRLTRLVYKSNTNELYFAGDGSSTTGFPFKSKSGAYNSTYKIARQSFLGYINSSLEHQWITNYGKGPSKYYNVLGFSVDNTGSIYMSGTTNSDSLVYASSIPFGSYVDSTLSNTDGFLAIFGTAKQLKHAHYFGGSSTESINNSDLLGDNTLYVVGQTKSNNFPVGYNTTTASLIDSTYNGTTDDDGFISRFNITQYNIVGVSEITNNTNGLSVYPNPANQSFNIKLETELNEKITITVYNSIGQLVHTESMINNLKTINCALWSTGLYIVSVKSKSINSSFKIIKD